jgi:AcrR family transcriptional regulator
MLMMGRDETRLGISRVASRLILDHGLVETSGDAIAAAAGMSTRTVWRHFRNKENCIQPVLVASIQRFARIMDQWPLEVALEDHLRVAMPLDGESPQLIADGSLAVHLVALCAKEPDIRAVWLDAYHCLETQLHEVIARRANRSTLDFDVRMCAATVVAAIRIVDQDISVAAVNGDRNYSPADLVELMSGAIRNAATLPICDPVASEFYRRSAARSAGAGRD